MDSEIIYKNNMQADLLISVSLAFSQGLLLALSPCILSILPIILSGSFFGKPLRPFGIVLGLIVSFISFSFLLGKFLGILGVNPDFLRLIASFLIVLFGLSMLFSFFEGKLEFVSDFLAKLGDSVYKFADSKELSQKYENDEKNKTIRSIKSIRSNGLISGLVMGACLGLIWSPCVGPLVGAAMVQAASQVSMAKNLLIISAFSSGVIIPILLIIFFGKRFSSQINFLKTNGSLLKKLGGVVILLTVFLNFMSHANANSFDSHREGCKIHI